jgi:hypothetical protein
MISEFEYDNEKKLLTITFAKGGQYQYSDVPKDVYEALLNAESVGKYFLSHMKDKYDAERL